MLNISSDLMKCPCEQFGGFVILSSGSSIDIFIRLKYYTTVNRRVFLKEIFSICPYLYHSSRVSYRTNKHSVNKVQNRSIFQLNAVSHLKTVIYQNKIQLHQHISSPSLNVCVCVVCAFYNKINFFYLFPRYL